MRYISADEVKQRLTVETCIGLMRTLFVHVAEGNVTHRLRTVMPIDQGKILGLMPGSLPYEDCVGTKIITVFHENFKKNIPSHQGFVVVFSADTGAPLGIVDGMAITAIRTAAVSAVATDALARKDAKHIGLIGAGMQAKTHLQALSKVRKFEHAYVWSVFPEEAQAFRQRESGAYDFDIVVCDTAAELAEKSDIICTVTSSSTPVLNGAWVKPGTHINAIGACKASDRELDSACVQQARFFGDSFLSVSNESGDYLIPVKEGILQEGHFLGELGDVLVGKVSGREHPHDITIFEALGLAVEDIACAVWLLKHEG